MTVLPLVLALGSALVGPPKLPPLPGTGGPEPSPEAPRDVAKPTVAPETKATRPTPRQDAAETGTPAEPESPDPREDPQDSEASSAGGAGVPELVDPPGKPSEQEPLPPFQPAPGSAPPPGPSASPPPPGTIPGEPPPPNLSFLPPPSRPPFGGNGLFIAAGTALGLAIVEQIVGHVLLKRNCIDRVAGKVFSEDEDLNRVLRRCGPSAVPALALRVHSDLALLAMIGLVSGGAVLRGRQAAHDHVFANAPAPHVRLRYAGIGLIGGGVLTWLTTSTGSWGWVGHCRTPGCVSGARIFGFAMRDVSAIMVAAGAGMLIYSEAHRRNSERHRRETGFGIQPAATASFFGLSASGRF